MKEGDPNHLPGADGAVSESGEKPIKVERLPLRQALAEKGQGMPTSIRIQETGKYKEIAWLCDGIWELPAQIDALEKWLVVNEGSLEKGRYAADVGYSPRPGACGGGTVVSIAAMQIMVNIGMELFLSEYPPFEDEHIAQDSEK